MAPMASVKDKPQPKNDGYTPEQRFFLGWGQIYCQNVRPEMSRMLVQVDPHSPGRDRVNGVVSNMPEFQKAYVCRIAQPMVAPPACRVWLMPAGRLSGCSVSGCSVSGCSVFGCSVVRYSVARLI